MIDFECVKDEGEIKKILDQFLDLVGQPSLYVHTKHVTTTSKVMHWSIHHKRLVFSRIRMQVGLYTYIKKPTNSCKILRYSTY